MKQLTTVCAAVVLGLAGCGVSNQESAKELTGGNPSHGKRIIREQGCASCHTIPGIRGARGLVGPSLERIASRSYIAGVLENTPQNMILWLMDPPGVDPLTAMPNLRLTENEARDVASYIYTLR